MGPFNTTIVNNLMGIQIIKSLMTFSFEKQSVTKMSQEYQQENIRAISISSAFNPLIRMGVLAGFLGTMLIGSYMALNGTLEVGSLQCASVFNAKIFMAFYNSFYFD